MNPGAHPVPDDDTVQAVQEDAPTVKVKRNIFLRKKEGEGNAQPGQFFSGISRLLLNLQPYHPNPFTNIPL